MIFALNDSKQANAPTYQTHGTWTSGPSNTGGATGTTTFTDVDADDNGGGFASWMIGSILVPDVNIGAPLIITGATATTLTVAGDARGVAANGSQYIVYAAPFTDPVRGTWQTDPHKGGTRYLWAGYRYQPPQMGFWVDPPGAPALGVYGAATGANRLGQYYCWNRTYDVNLGRWTTPDPVATPWWNLFTYINNNPSVSTDPNGLHACDGVLKSAAITALMAGAAPCNLIKGLRYELAGLLGTSEDWGDKVTECLTWLNDEWYLYCRGDDRHRGHRTHGTAARANESDAARHSREQSERMCNGEPALLRGTTKNDIYIHPYPGWQPGDPGPWTGPIKVRDIGVGWRRTLVRGGDGLYGPPGIPGFPGGIPQPAPLGGGWPEYRYWTPPCGWPDLQTHIQFQLLSPEQQDHVIKIIEEQFRESGGKLGPSAVECGEAQARAVRDELKKATDWRTWANSPKYP